MWAPEDSPSTRINKVLVSGPHTIVRVYTFQSAHAMMELSRRGFLSQPKLPDYDEIRHWGPAYSYMRNRLAQSVPDPTGDYPVWGWLKRPSNRKVDVPVSRITALVPRARILLSDYHDWHHCLNGWPILDSDEEYDSYYAGHLSVDAEETWSKIFQLTKRRHTVQVCVDRIYPNEIVQVRNYGP
jgi:hypothetical protein